MATTQNFKHLKGDTFRARVFQLSTHDAYSSQTAFPATGSAGVVYKALDSGLFYIWDTDEYVLTTTKVYIDLTGCDILLQLKRGYGQPVALSMTVGNGLTILNASTGQFQIDQQIIDIPAFVYIYDIQITFPSGVVETYISGTWTIVGDVSQYV